MIVWPIKYQRNRENVKYVTISTCLLFLTTLQSKTCSVNFNERKRRKKAETELKPIKWGCFAKKNHQSFYSHNNCWFNLLGLTNRLIAFCVVIQTAASPDLSPQTDLYSRENWVWNETCEKSGCENCDKKRGRETWGGNRENASVTEVKTIAANFKKHITKLFDRGSTKKGTLLFSTQLSFSVSLCCFLLEWLFFSDLLTAAAQWHY